MYLHKINRGKQQPQVNVIRMWCYTVMLIIFTPRAPKLYPKPNILLSIQEPCSPHALQKLFFLLFLGVYFIYLFMAVLGLRFCARAFSSCGKWGPLFIAVRGPLIIAASRCRAQAPDAQAQ